MMYLMLGTLYDDSCEIESQLKTNAEAFASVIPSTIDLCRR